MNETVIIDLTDSYILSPGTVYHVTVYVGFVTDLWYNYWDEEGVILTFTTYGGNYVNISFFTLFISYIFV
jgi:hypothetical protein